METFKSPVSAVHGVPPEGRIELHVPFAAGVHVTIFVVEEPAERFDDLLASAESSLAFRDNSCDDEDWNHAWPGRDPARADSVH